MRIIIEEEEFFVFKNIIYNKSIYYYNNEKTTLVDKFFSLSQFRKSDTAVKVLTIIISSPLIEDLTKEPAVVKVSYIEQMEELQSFLLKHFDIHMDYDFNFYTWTTRYSRNKNKNALFNKYDKKIKIFFSWKQVLSLYNDKTGLGANDFETINYEENIDNYTKYKHIKEKRRKMKNSTTNLKKYVYLNLKKKRKGKRGFFIDRESLVSLPC